MEFRMQGVFGGRLETTYEVHADCLDAARRVAEAAEISVTSIVSIEAETRWQYGFINYHFGDLQRALERAEQVIATSEEDSYAFWLALGQGLKGAVQLRLGRPNDAVPLLRVAIEGCDRIGSGILHTMFLGELTDALWAVGQRPVAWEALNRASDHNDRLGQCVFEAELHRRRGICLLDESADNIAAAEESLNEALAVARRQKARFFELRASIAMARLWQKTGRAVADVRHLVEGVYRGFTEGHETAPDLIAARAFLDTLA
jgi:adenylate cyclase